MRSLAITLLMLSLTCRAGPLPPALDSDAVAGRLPVPNLPADAYRPALYGVPVPTQASQQHGLMTLNAPIPVHKVRFEGGTVYLLSELREHYQPLVGREVTLTELLAVTERLTQRYRQDGYILSRAYLPPQDFADGRVQVVLVEGYISDYQLQGDIGPAAAYVERLLGKLTAERPLTRESFERYLGLIDRMPGVSAEAELAPGTGREGAMRLVLRVSRKAFAGQLTMTDGSRESAQALAGIASHAQTRFAEQMAARVSWPPGDGKARFYRLDYSQYLDDEGSRLLLWASRYRSEPRTYMRLARGGDVRQRWENERFGIGISQALIAKPGEWLDVVGRFYTATDHVAYRARLDDRDTYARVVSFEGDWRKVDADRLRIVSAGVYQGLDQLGARSDSDRDVDFLRLRLGALQSDSFSGNWQGVASAAFYWSANDLPDSERVLFGGQHFGRGYPADQASGDKGWGMAYELNRSFHPGSRRARLVQPYVVLDAARAWSNGLDTEDARMASVAVGLRLGDGQGSNLALEMAKPLADVALDNRGREPRLTIRFAFAL
ncbi:ShlB/FhaC/HecB family hemolysin secretion/activation protein [Pseudomonas guariconensis]|uniref:ShlB/FhaC/HecB family hemolysin secretion/activation protein n=1 Tax=Pseudomonas guariconensis TaxID=1288410 RepID=UPI0018AA120A|nr:ShlB/FhaC/HecB family hemolysin secretion/activation protein [Pseudomonas guariconensis]MBF8740564.1 ShlB/FhaC/HecB family hemolysin secretion/activation protein [Pseudomonas guariconensis]MBF8750791.1 ShlB/FhaC/HecB family hemolysin secretion/activation protein [Pseudomonas guariconensis]